jgi:hypothetical protein
MDYQDDSLLGYIIAIIDDHRPDAGGSTHL